MKRRKNEVLMLEGVKATATRAIFNENSGQHHRIQFTFTLDDSSKVEVTMDLDESSKFIQQALNSIEAATPAIPRPSHRSMF